ncbi:MAG: YHYH protein [Candidatus Pacebacteria bacterium]|nr:YHYH protein [Candidatus Paceibacterota bacterium]
MNIAALFVSVWLGFLSLLGLGAPQAPVVLSPQQHAATVTQQVAVAPAQTTAGSANNSTFQTTVSSHASVAAPTSSESANSGVATQVTLPTGSAWQTIVPLGDYEYSTSAPKKGYIYVCHVAQGGGGAQGNPTWISGNVWYPAQKIAVEGSVSWPNASYSMTVSGSERIIKSNDLPTDHNTGVFPIQSSDPAYQIDRNPNTIEAQNLTFTLPVHPTTLATPDCIYGQVGIMDDGVTLFDGFDAEYRDAVAHETQDQAEGHPDETGVYHNHGFESGPVKESVSTVVGFAFDGFPITGSLLPSGNYLHTADLDECHGLTSQITLDGKSLTMYHYVLTQDFPYSVSCFRGKSYEPKPGGASQSAGGSGQPQQGTQNQSSQGMPPSPPQAAISACAGNSSGASCSFSAQNGTVSGTCQTPPNQSALTCVPNR